ncbi:FAD/NAD(P)-binding protein [Prosthecobacter sp.]|uniref:FAD/NAD(P)-binding protein n=1 Tax=Prosthecobacter sp. TaxID=1965333 RepID=UPI00378329FC
MNATATLAIVGSGPSALYLLKEILAEVDVLKSKYGSIHIFEKSGVVGVGMPYSPETTDRFNMSNISSEELPKLPVSFADWLRSQSSAVLHSLGILPEKISEEEVYSRLALGEYFKAQYQLLTSWIIEAGIHVTNHAECGVTDIKDDAETGRVMLFTSTQEVYECDMVVIATGHQWPSKDEPKCGYYASPWPIGKLLADDGSQALFTIGTLGASLSAFDVVSSLSHRHGDFVMEDGRMVYKPHAGTGEFKIVMHSSQGLLPHLQFAQVHPMREIYRHVTSGGMRQLLDANGFLRIEVYFDRVCRRVLHAAFEHDGMPELSRKLEDPAFKFADFVETMTDKHDYANAFEGMRKEMVEAKRAVKQHKPIHWKEAVDDLMYTLNYHAELMPAEDHLLLQEKVMPFLMNVIAAMPLPSGNSILALYDAGKLEMVSGRVVRIRKLTSKGVTAVVVEQDGKERICTYRMFIDCSGQKSVNLRRYPFPSLVRTRRVRRAQSPFLKAGEWKEVSPEKEALVEKKRGQWFYETGGIDIDDAYRIIGADGRPNPRIHDIAFPHVTGHRPYSYGLQACAHTSARVVRSWVAELKENESDGDLRS